MSQELIFVKNNRGIVTLSAGGTNIYLPTLIENDYSSFTIDETCECVYDSDEEERVVVCKKGDRVLVVSLDWDSEIQRIFILEVSPDNHTPDQVN